MPEIFSAILAVAFTLVLCVYAYATDRDRPSNLAMQPAHGEPNPHSTRTRREKL
jgi:hypothetical protein